MENNPISFIDPFGLEQVSPPISTPSNPPTVDTPQTCDSQTRSQSEAERRKTDAEIQKAERDFNIRLNFNFRGSRRR